MRYEIKWSARKTVSVEIGPDCSVLVRAPLHMSRFAIDRFVASKRGWIEKHLAMQKQRMGGENADLKPEIPFTEAQMKVLRKAAKESIPPRVSYWASLMGLSFGSISIRAQKTRWGSCSVKGNLNFNCLLMLAPDEVRDYVIIHELAHIRHMDHSKDFWALVARYCPEFKEHKRWLGAAGAALIRKLP